MATPHDTVSRDTVSHETDHSDRHGGRFRIPRSRGAVSGLLLLLLGGWVAAIGFVGPLFDFGYTPNDEFDMTDWRFWYELLPGVVAAVGGLLLLVAANRAATLLGAWLAVVAGAWLLVGPTLAPVLPFGDVTGPIPKASDTETVLETLLLFTGVGAAILALGAIALGRLSVVSLRDVRAAEQRDRHADRTAVVRREPVVDSQPAQPVQSAEPVRTAEPVATRPVEPAYQPVEPEPRDVTSRVSHPITSTTTTPTTTTVDADHRADVPPPA